MLGLSASCNSVDKLQSKLKMLFILSGNNLLKKECDIYSCVMCAYRGQKNVLDPLELEIQVVVNHHVSPGD